MPTGEKAPYFKFYPFDFDSDFTQRKLDCAGVGIYTRLLVLQWIEGGLEDDLEALRAYCGASDEEWTRAWRLLEAKFPVNGDGHRKNPRLERERQNMEAGARKRSSAAKNAADARWSDAQRMRDASATHAQGNADALPIDANQNHNQNHNQKEISSDSDESARVVAKPNGKPQEPTTQLELAEYRPSVQWVKLDDRVFMLPEEELRLKAHVENEAAENGLRMLTENEWRESEAHLNRDLVLHRERRGPRTLPGLVRNHFKRALWIVNNRNAPARASPPPTFGQLKDIDTASRIQKARERDQRKEKGISQATKLLPKQ